MKNQLSNGGLAAWSIRHPVAVIMLALTVVVLGLFSIKQLSVDLLPQIIYPEVRVRIFDPGVPATIVEDTITRQLEEQLAITEHVTSIQSTTTEGRSSVNLGFPYGTDIDVALRDASTRLDRARRFFPTDIDPPIIYKKDPSQIPVMDLVISSTSRDSIALRDWVDYEFSNWFLNIPGVASTEVGGGKKREIQIVLNQDRLAQLGLTYSDIKDIINKENKDYTGGKLLSTQGEFSTRTDSKFRSLADLEQLPVALDSQTNQPVLLSHIATISDTAEDQQLYIRLNGVPGVKLSIQKQPTANAIDVVDAINKRITWLKKSKQIPEDIEIGVVKDRSQFVRHSLINAISAAVSGALLAMLIVFLFLGRIKHTLIIGTAIPLAIFTTLSMMAINGLTLNIMTLGGFAIGVGILIDSTIVMLENISRHRQTKPSTAKNDETAIHAAQEVYSPLIAASSTNLVAILPILFISGLTGLLFSELIFTLFFAILASLIVSLTLVPALGKNVPAKSTHYKIPEKINATINYLTEKYQTGLKQVLKFPTAYIAGFLVMLVVSLGYIVSDAKRFQYLPKVDEGVISISVEGDSGTKLDSTNEITRVIEALVMQDEDVRQVYNLTGGFVFGRSEFFNGGRASISVVLKANRILTSKQWISKMRKQLADISMPGFRIHFRVSQLWGLRRGRGDDDISLRIQGSDIDTLRQLATNLITTLEPYKKMGLRNIYHTYGSAAEELSITVDKKRAASIGITAQDIGTATRVALQGLIVSEFYDRAQSYDIRLRLPRESVIHPSQLGNIIVSVVKGKAIRLQDVASIKKQIVPGRILRDNQRRTVEVSASILSEKYTGSEIMTAMQKDLDKFRTHLPAGYLLYDAGDTALDNDSKQLGLTLLFLAIFLIYVVMAIQYESFKNPFIIIISILFATIGVALGLWLSNFPDGLPLSMPVILGMLMLAGIVVNNAIMLVEQIEIQRGNGEKINTAIINAGKLRLRPILMTMLTTVFGMLPLALGIGQGSEMLQPLAITIVWGLLFATLVSLVLVPCFYNLFHTNKTS